MLVLMHVLKKAAACVPLVLLLAACNEPPATNIAASTITEITALKATNADVSFKPFDLQARYTRELYVVATAGPGGNGSKGSPFADIASALAQAVPGTRIHITAGTYPALGLITNAQGTPTAPIALVAEGKVIIDANGNGSGMSLRDPRYLTLEGITIQNTGIHGINIDDGGSYDTPAEYIVLRRMHFRQIGSGNNNDCLKMSGVKNFYIVNSEFEGCNLGEAIDMVGCHDGIITSSYFHDVVINGVQTKGGSSDILIHGNLFANIPQRAINLGGDTGTPYFRPLDSKYEAERIRVLANVFVRTGSAAVAFVGCNACIVANNTIIEPHGYVSWVIEEDSDRGPGRDGYFINNLILFNTSQLNKSSFINENRASLTQTFTFDANLWFALDNPGFRRIPDYGNINHGNQTLIQTDPQLDQFFRPTRQSVILGKGIPVPGGLVTDFAGKSYDNKAVIGAFSIPDN